MIEILEEIDIPRPIRDYVVPRIAAADKAAKDVVIDILKTRNKAPDISMDFAAEASKQMKNLPTKSRPRAKELDHAAQKLITGMVDRMNKRQDIWRIFK
jgi:hypothetical protein